ncbi:MAG: HNH endonuclease, partial [Planctomycetales bacterium]|nr:HNH endonuclease [Planctomycetales bacterium]
IVQYYYVYGVRPQFIHFDDRSRYNFESVAREAVELDLTIRQKNEWLARLWNDAQQPWQVFFGVDGQPDFERIVDAAIRRLSNFHTDSDDSQAPVIELGRRSLDDLSMSELKIADADLYWEIRREVESKSRTKDGQYRCARTQFTSRNRHDFEVDHIVPRAKGGKTSSDNLQLVHWRENRRKGND